LNTYRVVDYPKNGGGSFFLKIQRYCLYNRILYQEDFTLHTNDQEMLNISLDNDQLNAQIFNAFITILYEYVYMFRANLAHPQEVKLY